MSNTELLTSTTASTTDVKPSPPVLLLWSGGADSTLALWQYLKDGRHVRTLTVINNQCGKLQMEAELAARNAIEHALLKRRMEFYRTEIQIRCTKGANAVMGAGGPSPMPFIWLSHGVQAANWNDGVALAYIRGDDVWHSIDGVKRTFEWGRYLMGKHGGLEFPLEWLTKADVLTGLREARLVSKVWYCEDPVQRKKPSFKYKPCGECTSCRKHAAGMRGA